MRTEMIFKDARLLEALDYLDPDFIDEAIDIMRIPPANQSPERDRKTTILSVKLIVALAASLLLISACIPVVSKIIRNYFSSPGGLLSSDTEETLYAPESDGSTANEETTSPEPIDYSDVENLPELYRAVLKNEMGYYMRYLNVEGERFISDPPTQYALASDLRYAAIDMDGDGGIEVAVKTAHLQSDIVILHIEGDRVYGFDFNFTQLEEIQDDGNFIWSNFSNNTTGFSAISFTGGYEYKLCEICSKSTSILNVKYYVSGKEATREEYSAVYDKLSKTEVIWYPLRKYYPETTTQEDNITAPADVEYDGSRGLEYRINSDGRTVTLVGYGSCKDRDVIVATLYDGKPVTVIGASAFEDCRAINSVVLPEGLQVISDKAFKGCDVLKSVIIPDDVKSIGKEAFKECKYLNSIVIPESVTAIYDGAFAYCSKLISVTLPSQVDHFGTHMFEWCTSLTSIALPKGTKLLDCTFYVCQSLRDVSLPYGITGIGAHSFNGCTALESITLPSSVEKIDSFSFAGCDKLTDFNYNAVLSRWIGTVRKEEYWNQDSPFAAVHCLDGDIRPDSLTEEEAFKLVADHLGLKTYNFDPDWLWVRKYPSTSSPKYRIAHSVKKDGAYPVVAQYEIDIYSLEITPVGFDLSDIPDALCDVVTNKRTFFIYSDNREFYLKDFGYPDEIAYSSFLNYCVMDMDGDGKSELLIDGMNGILLLHDNGTSVRGYIMGIHNVYASGAYSWSELTSTGKTGIERIVSFTEDGYKTEELCRTEQDENGNVKYFIGEHEVGADEHFAFVESHSSYNADWRELDYYPIYMKVPN